MASMSDYLEGQVRGYCLRGQTFTQPATVYVALCTAATADSQTGSTITEVSGGGYARLAVTCNTSEFTAASSTDGVSANGNAWSWTASGANYGTVTHVAICSASSAGNLLFHGALASSRTINDGDTFQINAGSFTITFA